MGIDAFELDLNVAAFGGELDGIGEEVPHDLLQAAGVAGDAGGEGVDDFRDADAFGIGAGLDGFDGLFNDIAEFDAADIQAQFAGKDARHVEQVFDELHLNAHVAFDDGETLGEIGGGDFGGAEDLSPAEDGVDGRAEFVGERGDELFFKAGGFFGFGAGLLFRKIGAFKFVGAFFDADFEVVGEALEIFVGEAQCGGTWQGDGLGQKGPEGNGGDDGGQRRDNFDDAIEAIDGIQIAMTLKTWVMPQATMKTANATKTQLKATSLRRLTK